MGVQDGIGEGVVEMTGKDEGIASNRSPPEYKQDGIRRKAWLRRNVKRPVARTWKRYIIEGLFRQKPLPPTKDGRHVSLDASRSKALVDERRGHAYISNSIRSSRYTIWDFLPKQLWFQLTRVANMFFLAVGIPQTIPGYSTTGNFTTILPLMFFILLTIAKEGYDDFRRSRLDKAENNMWATVLGEQGDVRDVRDASLAQKSHWLLRVPLLQRLVSKSAKPMPEHDPDEDDQHCWKSVRWQDIKVGDVLKLKRDDPFPADVVLLRANGPDGMAYVETMALDGETSLKAKQSPAATRACSTITGLKSHSIEVAVEDPNRDLYDFNGRLTVDGVTTPLTLGDVALRGCVLRNTGVAIGLVINTGEECKIRMNANHHPEAKKPRMEHYANQIVLSLIFYVVVQSVGVSMGYLLWHRSTEQKSWYISNAPVGFDEIIVGFLIMFNNVIPLALYISLEIVKVGQQLMVSSDVEMYDEETDTPMRCNTNTILEDLGSVGYLLSDKTGTLTENVMKLRKMSIAGTVWTHRSHGLDSPQPPQSATQKEHVKATGNAGKPSIEVTEVAVPEGSSSLRPPAPRRSSSQSRQSSGEPTSELETAELINYIKTQPNTAFSRKTRDYILGLALCHTCLPEVQKDGSVDYQASSPDELALASAAQELGYSVVHRTSNSITLQVKGAEGYAKETYEILDIIEFSSKRKRMSVILRCPDGKIWMLCKGADSALIPRLRQAELAGRKSKEVRRSIEAERAVQRRSIQLERRSGPGDRPSMAIERIRQSMDLRPSFDSRGRPTRPSLDRLRVPSLDGRRAGNELGFLESVEVTDDADVFARCFKHLNEFATNGLRTLLFAHKVVSATEYAAWKNVYLEATTSLVDRQERIEAAGEVIEQNFDLLGASAIEDKLQKGVPETIEKLRRANIRIWMLTGDKRETAIQIAHSARICRPESLIFVIDSTKGDLRSQIQSAADSHVTSSVHSVAVIDGHTLSVVEETPHLKTAFFSLIFTLDSVICCRASPAQKASIAKSIPAHSKALTLAIGDGANDIAMIQAAHVGVGISGKEGLQASRVADYSIAQFRFLQRLLLVHGRWNYIRTAKFILWTFWKEMLFYMMQALYQRYNGYTGTSLYENWSLTALNTLFTSLCVIVPGMFEQDLAAGTLLSVPELYAFGQKNRGLNWVKFVRWMANGAAEGMVLWFVPWAVYGKFGGVMNDNGLFALGDLVFTEAIVWTNVKLLLLETHAKTKIVLISFAITFSGWWAWNAFLSGVYSDNLSPYDVRGGLEHTFGNDPVWWLTLILSMVCLTLFELGIKGARKGAVSLGIWPVGRWGREGGDVDRELRVWQELEMEGLVGARLGRGEEEDEVDEEVLPVGAKGGSIRLEDKHGDGWSSEREEVVLGAKRQESGVRIESIELRRL